MSRTRNEVLSIPIRRLGEMIAFVLLVSMAVWVTLDLNQPQRGLITVSQEPMQRLLAGMEK